MKIEKIDEVYLRINCSDESFLYDLRDKFSFKPKGYEWSPAFKKGFWDGNKRLFDIRSNTLYLGLLNKLIDFIKEKELTIEAPDYFKPKIFSQEYISNFIDSLQIPSKFEKRDYQLDAIAKCFEQNRLMLVCPTNSGKSLIAYVLTRFYNSKTIIIVPSINLVFQLFSDFKDYGFDSEKNCLMVCNEQARSIVSDKQIIITTWQSLFTTNEKKKKKVLKFSEDVLNQFKTVIVDEAHRAEAKSLVTVMENLKYGINRFGMTGTLTGVNNSTVDHMVLEGLLGPIYKATSNKELIDQGYSSKVNIKVILLKYLDSDKNILKKMEYHQEVEWLTKHPARQRFICNLAKSLKGNTLVLFTLIEHGKRIYETLRTTSSGRNVYLIYGEVPGSEREEIRNIVNKDNSAIIVATYKTLSLGVNIPNLHNLIFSSPAKSEYSILQSIGRILRIGDNKDSATIYDIVDDASIKNKESLHLNYALNHFKERMGMYNLEQFPYKMSKIELQENVDGRSQGGLLGML